MTTKILNIDSSLGGNLDPNQFSYTFNVPITGLKKVHLLYASIPNSMYVFRSGVNNIITFTEMGMGGVQLTATITPGNYRDIKLATEIAAKMTAVSAVAPGLGYTYTCTLSNSTTNQDNNLFTISSTGPYGLNTTENFFPNLQLGFFGTGPIVATLSGGTYNITSQTQYYLLPPQYLLINIEELGDQIVTQSGAASSNFMVPLNGESYMISNFGANSFFNYTINSSGGGFTKFKIRVLNKDGISPGLFLHWFMILGLETN